MLSLSITRKANDVLAKERGAECFEACVEYATIVLSADKEDAHNYCKTLC